MMKCLKCQKEYNPKRSDKLFCGESCGNAYRQQQKRDALKKARLVGEGLAIKNPLTKDEEFLWYALADVANTAMRLTVDAKLPDDKRPADFGVRVDAFIEHTRAAIYTGRVREIGARLNEQGKAEKRANEALKTKQEKRTAQSNTK